MMLKLFTIAAVLLSSVAIKADDIVVIPDTPNIGDTTTITTITTGLTATTNNLISQDFADGTWTGTMYPDNSDINESTWLTGKDGKYAETTINSQDYFTLDELKLGMTSTLGADIRWWNPVESTVTMSQIATNGLDTTEQHTTLHDTTNHNYQLNNYQNILVIEPNPLYTHGTLTARFSFDIQGNSSYNGGHSGVDVTDPTLTIDYTTLSSTTVTSVEYCWQKNPPTCPAQEQILEVQDIIESIEIFDPIILDAVEVDTTIFIEPEEDDFFFEEDEIEIEYYDDFELEYIVAEDIVPVQTVEIFDDLPELAPEEIEFVETYVEEFIPEEITTEEIIEEFSDLIEEEIIVAEEPIEEIVEEEAIEIVEEPVEEIIEEQPIEVAEETIKEEVVQEEVIEEESVEVAKEEVVEEETVEEVAEKKEPKTEESVEIKKAKLEKLIDEKGLDAVQKVSITLQAVNMLVSQEIINQAVDIKALQNNNTQELFTYSVMPTGANMVEVSLPSSYFQDLYNNTDQIALMVGNDPLALHDIAVSKAVNLTNEKLAIYRSLINAKYND